MNVNMTLPTMMTWAERLKRSPGEGPELAGLSVLAINRRGFPWKLSSRLL
jgi:hypothetical protein